MITRLEVYKSRRILLGFDGDVLQCRFKIALGKQPVGAKEFEGDLKTPEGMYFITDRNDKSSFYKNLGISYPEEKDVKHAESLGRNPGNAIKIHGLRNGQGWKGRWHRLRDWTAGCIAVTNKEMDFLFDEVEIGARIDIYR